MGYHEVIAVIGQLVKSHREHPRLKELVILSDPDPEADFFENVRHIQVSPFSQQCVFFHKLM